jgi:hypothetical protein
VHVIGVVLVVCALAIPGLAMLLIPQRFLRVMNVVGRWGHRPHLFVVDLSNHYGYRVAGLAFLLMAAYVVVDASGHSRILRLGASARLDSVSITY